MAEYLKQSRPFVVQNENEDSLFVNFSGHKLTRQGVWKIIKVYTEAANIKKSITPHTIRHSFAAHLFENGADLASLKEILGHSDISSTQIYAKLAKSKTNEMYKRCHPKAQ
ncbi:Tyrosine recombinase XerD [bioreactor metagenome]|uniref:Tyrosine recombinase XerD n=1 Tax=bioreactor metagenome TaxID=1076179 RepID=A0A645J3T1_9ZZZZ